MKIILSLLTASAVLIPTAAMSQQVNYYQTCTAYKEVYVPGYYDQYANYIQGRVNIQSYQTNCGSSQSYQSYQPQQQYYQRQRVCNPTAGAVMGAGLAEALSGGNGYKYTSNYNRNYNRNNSSGSYNYSYRNYKSNGWTLFGAGLGALAFSC
jgi:hypothetical protein